MISTGHLSLIDYFDDFLLSFEWVLMLVYSLNIWFSLIFFYSYVEKPENYPVIGTKWVFRNKLDEHGIIIRNMAMLVS